MAFEIDKLDSIVVNPAGGPSLYTYMSTDDIGTGAGQMRADGYFTDLKDFLPLGLNTPQRNLPVLLLLSQDANGKIDDAALLTLVKDGDRFDPGVRNDFS